MLSVLYCILLYYAAVCVIYITLCNEGIMIMSITFKLNMKERRIIEKIINEKREKEYAIIREGIL
jgi:hypothetical protein